MIADDDRITDPDPRSPYECILSELVEIKGMLGGPDGLTMRVRRAEVLALLSAVAAALLAACELVR